MARAMRISGVMLMVFGFTLAEFVGYELIGTTIQANARQAVLEEQFGARLSLAQMREPSQEEDRPPVTTLPAPRADGVIAWARLRIPRIKITKVVVEGAVRRDLINGPGHYAGTPLPGVEGSVGIAGHRTTWGAPFYNLDKLRSGDDVILQTAAGRYRYRVTRSTVVKPNDTVALFGDPDSEARHKLTLTTCTPRYSAARRLIVWADLVSWKVAA